METSELMGELLALAREAQLEVRVVGAAGQGEAGRPVESATCRVRGNVWVMLATADPVEVQLDVLVDALRKHAAELIESRYLSPAVRERLGDRAGGGQEPV